MNQSKDPQASTFNSSKNNKKNMDKAEKPKKPFQKRIQSLDVEKRKKMYKNKRKPVHEENLWQDPVIIPLESTIY